MLIHFDVLNSGHYKVEIPVDSEDPLGVIISSLFQQHAIPAESARLVFGGRQVTTNAELRKIFEISKCDEFDPIYVIARAAVSKVGEKALGVVKEAQLEEPNIMAVFHSQVEKYSDCISTSYDNKSLSYKELDQKSNQLAHFLMERYSITPNMPIAIIGSSKLEMLICELAILKSGGAFVPFEPGIPRERLDYTLKNAKAKLIIACDNKSVEVVSNITPDCAVLDLIHNQTQISERSMEPLKLGNAKDSDLAYILYTSGSTSATPKGVMQTRGGLLGQIKNYTENLKITHQDQFLQLASMTHDQAIVDTYGALLNGAALHLYSMDMKTVNFQVLREFIINRQISIFSSIPSVFSFIFEGVENDTSFPNLRIVTLGGEAVKIDHVKLYQKIARPNCLFINGYGATEFSWLSYFIIEKSTPLDKMNQIPLGHLASGTKIYLDFTDGDKANGIGELCVHSPFMSPGYWNNSEATQKAFFKHGDKIFYRTGDLVTLDFHKILHFKGRLNWHEKINGKRINLKDIEDQMLQKFPFEECIVLSHGEENKRLYAFYTVKKGADFSMDEKSIRIVLSSSLKAHEIPFKFYALAQFPLLQNSKVNRLELKKTIDLDIQERKQNRNVQNLNVVDQLFCEILDLKEPMEDTVRYRDLGASSIDMMHFVNKLNTVLAKDSMKVQIEISELREADTPGKIKELITEKQINLEKEWRRDNTPYYEFKPIFYYGDWNYIYINTDYKTLVFNYQCLEILASYYNEKFNISVNPCKSHEDFLDKLETFIEKGEYGRIGLTWVRNNIKNGHPTSCIFVINEEGISLYISDTLGDFPQGLDEKLQSLKNYHSLKIYVNPCSQQVDEESCSLHTISYLVDALRMDFSKAVIKLSQEEIKKIPDWKLKFIPKNVHFFQNPPELLKNDQSDDFPLNQYAAVDLTTPLMNGQSLDQFRKENCKEMTYVEYLKDKDFENKTAPDRKIVNNCSLYELGKEYQQIIDEALQKQLKTT